MPSEKRHRKPKCLCSATLWPDGRCPHGCERYAKPAARVREAQKGRPEEPHGLPTADEVSAAYKKAGIRILSQSPLLLTRRRKPTPPQPPEATE